MSTPTSKALDVVHSSFGRVRVHLPDPDGHIALRVRRLPGVRFAQGNQWTENMLILFEPAVASEAEVLGQVSFAALAGPALELPVLVGEIVPGPAMQIADKESGRYVTGLRRTIYQALGWVSVGLAVIGFAVPGIPGAPFVVLAGYFFVRSSPKSHAWLLRSRWFGPILRDWEEHHGVRRSLKYTAFVLIAIAIVVILLSGLPTALIAAILICEIIGMIIVMRLRVVEPTPAPTMLALTVA